MVEHTDSNGSGSGAQAAGADRVQRILISEDDADLRSVLAAALSAAGYAVTETRDGRELVDALQASPKGHFHLVISDHRMPRLHGIEALALMVSRAPFIILSGDPDPAVRAAAEKLGASAVLQKPFGLPDLLGLVRVLVSSG